MTPHVFARTNGVIQSRYEADVKEFPSSYIPGLSLIKELYPNSKFIYYDTGLDWYNDLLSPNNEMLIGRNLIPSNRPSSWKSVDPSVYDVETDEYKDIEPGWSAASQEVIEYYMDPRNFFTQDQIFQFVQLSYNGSETPESVEKLIHYTFLSDSNGKNVVDLEGNRLTWAEAIVKIGKETGVSPYLLAARVIQEQGGGGTTLCSGNSSFGGGAYVGYYNYFNINAYGPTTEAIVVNGLSYAKSCGWDTPYKGFLGGAQVLAGSYVGIGKDTLYLQHWNFVANEYGSVSYTPYMTSTVAPHSETSNMRRCYDDPEGEYTFIIPVFKNMPEEICELPDGDGNGNYYLKNIKVSGVELGEFSPQKLQYESWVPEETFFIDITAESYSPVTMNVNGTMIENKVTSLTKSATLNYGINNFFINVTAENGLSRTYGISIMRDSGNPWYSIPKAKLKDNGLTLSEPIKVKDLIRTSQFLHCEMTILDNDENAKDDESYCATGDMVVIRDENDDIIYQNRVILLGDVNKDGIVNENDLQIIANDLFGVEYLDNFMLLVADIDNNGKLELTDIAAILKMANINSVPTSNTPVIKIKAMRSAFCGQDYVVALDISEGNYVSEGYLLYNNGVFTTKNCNNDGSVHFLVAGDRVYFETQEQALTLTPLVEDAEFTIRTHYVATYNDDCDYFEKVECDSCDGKILKDRYGISLTNNKVMLNQKELTNLILTNGLNINSELELEVSEGFVFNNHTNKLIVNGFTGTLNVNVFASNDLQPGLQKMTVTILGDDGYSQINSFDISVMECPHLNKTQYDYNQSVHSFSCLDCNNSIEESHQYVHINRDLYTCSVCGRQSYMSLIFKVPTFYMNTENVITVSPRIGGVDASDYECEWYLDYELLDEDTNKLTLKFADESPHTITCVARVNANAVLIASKNIQARSLESITNIVNIVDVTCDKIVLSEKQDVQYYLNDKEMDSNEFLNLKPNTEYEVSVIYKNKKYTTTLRTAHNGDLTLVDATCIKNAAYIGTCEYCNKELIYELTDTKNPHVFINYYMAERPTCNKGTIYESVCENGCETKYSYQNNDRDLHNYVEIEDNNDADCENIGTKVIECVVCKNKETVAARNTALKHLFTDYIEVDLHTRISECGHNCGAINTITIVDREISVINIRIKDLIVGQSGLSSMKLDTNGLHFKNYKLVCDDLEITKESSDAIIQSNKLYILSELQLELDVGYKFSNDLMIYINGKLVNCEYKTENNMITCYDLGRFLTTK